MHIGLWSFDRLRFYETTSFAMILLTAVICVSIWTVFSWLFGRKVTGLAAILGLVNSAAISGIAGSLLTIADWGLTTAIPQTTKAALALPLVGIVLAVALAYQTIRTTTNSKRLRLGLANRRRHQGFAARILPWLCIIAEIALAWFLNIWNLLGWKF